MIEKSANAKVQSYLPTVRAKIKRQERLSVPTPRKTRFLSSDERQLLRQQYPRCPVCFSTRIHVYAERLASGKPIAGCRACNRVFSLG
jgi:hypothetical protein